MTDLTLGLINLAAGLCIAYSTGANDAANAMGTAVGAGVRTVRQATLLVVVFGLIGALVQGGTVAATMSGGIVALGDLQPRQAQTVALAAYLSAGLWTTFTTYLGLPTSSSHSLTGAMAGAGLASHLVAVYWAKLGIMVAAWIAAPIGAGAAAYLLASCVKRLRWREHQLARFWSVLLTLGATYMAYAWGAAGIANAAGPLVHSGLLEQKGALVAGGLAAALGVALWGKRVMTTVGSELTPLVPSTAFTSEVSAALVVHLCASLGLPVSSSHAIVGSVIGTGLSRRRRSAPMGTTTLARILTSWAITPLVCFAMAYALYLGVNRIA